MAKGVKKQWEKIMLNSFLPLHSNDYFIMFDEGKAKAITSEGKKILDNGRSN